MTEWVKVPDYQPMIGTECMVCGKEINLGYYTNQLVPMICEDCKEAIKFAKALKNGKIKSQYGEVDWKKLLVDDFEKHLNGET